MKTTRIKWDEAMLTRCLARLADFYLAPVKAKEYGSAKAADSDNSFKLDIPSVSPSVSPCANVTKIRKDGWDDFKNAISKAL
jgi:hypothetical protein